MNTRELALCVAECVLDHQVRDLSLAQRVRAGVAGKIPRVGQRSPSVKQMGEIRLMYDARCLMLFEEGDEMRTTLTIDDDVLLAAKGLADRQQKSLGEVISTLARQALKPTNTRSKIRNGIHLLPVRAGAVPVTMALVNQLRDELP